MQATPNSMFQGSKFPEVFIVNEQRQSLMKALFKYTGENIRQAAYSKAGKPLLQASDATLDLSQKARSDQASDANDILTFRLVEAK